MADNVAKITPSVFRGKASINAVLRRAARLA